MSTSGRTNHGEKITVYLTPDELARLDKLVCHIKHDLGIKVDRSRVVREAIAILRDDIHQHSSKGTSVRRLRAAGEMA